MPLAKRLGRVIYCANRRQISRRATASGGDIRIDASGKLSLAQASSQGDLKIAAQAVELNGKTYAGGSAEI
ncbi:hypothetical protein CJU09_33675, partial [Pseudomonas aeruginosa]